MARAKDPQRRASILAKALTLFAERGFHAVSVKDIAQASEISLGSLYTYFDSKEQLANVLFCDCKTAFAGFVSVGTDTLAGRCAHRQLWTNVGRFALAQPEIFAFLEAQVHRPYLDQEARALELTLTEALVDFYVSRLGLGLSPRTAQLAISASFGAYVQVYKAAQVGLLAFDDATLKDLEELAWRMASAFDAPHSLALKTPPAAHGISSINAAR